MRKKEYDYLIVGSGLFGATFAYKARQAGKRCLVIDRRSHLGGNVYCENIGGINVHKYGAHIFHTSDKEVWEFVNSIVPFNRYTNAPVANWRGQLYNLPFNMNTFNRMWGVTTPDEARAIIETQRRETGITDPQNLEEQALMLIGRDIYERLIKGYTEKQWGRPCTELPAFIIKRLPVRFVYDNNYFNDRYQGIPEGGYNRLIDGLLEGTETVTGADYLDDRDHWDALAETVVFTGEIDRYFGYCFGRLEYRTVSFDREGLGDYADNIVDIVYCNSLYEKSYELAQELMRKYPDLELIAGMNEYSAVGVGRAVSDAGAKDKIAVVGVDCSQEAINLMEMGVYKGIIVQKAFRMGYIGVEETIHMLNGDAVEKNIDSGCELVTPENMYNSDIERLIFPFS